MKTAPNRSRRKTLWYASLLTIVGLAAAALLVWAILYTPWRFGLPTDPQRDTQGIARQWGPATVVAVKLITDKDSLLGIHRDYTFRITDKDIVTSQTCSATDPPTWQVGEQVQAWYQVGRSGQIYLHATKLPGQGPFRPNTPSL